MAHIDRMKLNFDVQMCDHMTLPVAASSRRCNMRDILGYFRRHPS